MAHSYPILRGNAHGVFFFCPGQGTCAWDGNHELSSASVTLQMERNANHARVLRFTRNGTGALSGWVVKLDITLGFRMEVQRGHTFLVYNDEYELKCVRRETRILSFHEHGDMFNVLSVCGTDLIDQYPCTIIRFLCKLAQRRHLRKLTPLLLPYLPSVLLRFII